MSGIYGVRSNLAMWERSYQLTLTLAVGPLRTTFWRRRTVCERGVRTLSTFGVNGLGTGHWPALGADPFGGLSDSAGMRLLDGYDLNIQVKSGGRVAIQPME